MPQRLQNILDWFQNHAKTLDLLPEYTRSVYARWNDYLWGELPVAPVVIWWIFGSPPMWVVVPTFFWAFLIAGYYVWRGEHLKLVAPTRAMLGTIQGLSIMRVDRGHRMYLNIRIVNRGPSTAIYDWKARHVNANGANNYVPENVFETPELGPDGKPGGNLLHDERIMVTGDVRSGWLAFRLSSDDVRRILEGRVDQNVHLSFVDAFGKRHQVSMFPEEE
jgi:hypothetical protein